MAHERLQNSDLTKALTPLPHSLSMQRDHRSEWPLRASSRRPRRAAPANSRESLRTVFCVEEDWADRESKAGREGRVKRCVQCRAVSI